ncbi:MAG: DUF4214 domain-containing protein [Reyranellaceae bacterium]
MSATVFPFGPDVRVNTTTGGSQTLPAIAALAGGGFVVTWTSQTAGAAGDEVEAQLYNARGERIGSEFTVNTTSEGSQSTPSVAALADGGFVVTWTNANPGTGDLDVYARRYGDTGAPAAPEFLVNTSQQAGPQFFSSVAGLSGGGFVIVWEAPGSAGNGLDIFGQRYLASGVAQGNAFRVPPGIEGQDERLPAVVTLQDGGFIVTYTKGDGGPGFNRFDANGVQQDTPFHIFSGFATNYPAVAELLNGNHVVVWSSDGEDGSGAGIYGERFSGTTGLNVTFRISATTSGDQTYPSIITMSDGGFLVTWSSMGQDGSGWGVYGRRYSSQAVALGDEFRINATTDGDQVALSQTGSQDVAMLANGQIVQVWSGTGTEEVFYRFISPAIATDDAYVVLAGHQLTATPDIGLLSNDVRPPGTSVDVGGLSGSRFSASAADGSFTYAPGSFTGIDDVAYSTVLPDGSSKSVHVEVYVVPVNVGATSTTLDLVGLTAREQIAATYVAFFGRAADVAGFDFWVNEFNVNHATQSPATLFANIASSFGVSNEAKALYPFLVSPFGASDGAISAFIDQVYGNMFNRGPDAAGLAYWTAQTKATLQAGQFVGSILVNIMSGAQDTAAGHDITTLISKVAVSLHFVEAQRELLVGFDQNDQSDAGALLDGVTDQPSTVLVGIATADLLAAAKAQ